MSILYIFSLFIVVNLLSKSNGVLRNSTVNILKDVDTTILYRHNNVTNFTIYRRSKRDAPLHDTLHQILNISDSTSSIKILPLISFERGTESIKVNQKPEMKVKSGTKIKGWLFALLTMVCISILGLMAVLCVPIMQRMFYDKIITFLIALAIGCLTGDAILHLLPHAFDSGHDDSNLDGHKTTTLKGLCAIAGIYAFLFCERLMRRKAIYKKRLMQTCVSERNPILIETCGERILIEDDCNEPLCNEENRDDILHSQNDYEHSIISESSKGVGNLLVVGDALHNFADGLAIGASFAEHVTAGICTGIAVVCHELPHEIGLFAVLMKTGMTIKKAIFFNCVSSIMSIIGAMCGLYIGQMWSIAPWIFATIAGIFLYLALVDMLPELTINPDSLVLGCILENSGFICGLTIMSVIAYYEDDIDRILPRT